MCYAQGTFSRFFKKAIVWLRHKYSANENPHIDFYPCLLKTITLMQMHVFTLNSSVVSYEYIHVKRLYKIDTGQFVSIIVQGLIDSRETRHILLWLKAWPYAGIGACPGT